MRERCTHVVYVYFGDDLCWTLAVLTSLLLPRCVLKLMLITIAPAADIDHGVYTDLVSVSMLVLVLLLALILILMTTSAISRLILTILTI